MGSSKDVLSSFAKGKSTYFVLPDNEEVVVRFIKAEQVPNHFDQGKTMCIRYHLEVDGKIMFWDRSSRILAKMMEFVPEGMNIRLRKTGERANTKYFVEMIDMVEE